MVGQTVFTAGSACYCSPNSLKDLIGHAWDQKWGLEQRYIFPIPMAQLSIVSDK